MAGLLAARVLSDHYGEILVVERDELPHEPINRRGVPQGRHGHTLLPGGCRALERLFPGLLPELADAGVPVVSRPEQFYFAPGGRPLRLGPDMDDLTTYVPSRPRLEWQVRRRVAGLPNVQILAEHEAVGPIREPEARRLIGVQVAGPDGSRSLLADLVVDARGRGAATPAWLEQLGFPRPSEQAIDVDTRYVTQCVRMPAASLPERLVLVGPHAGCHRGLGLFSHENDTWDFTVIGVRGQRPPAEHAAMVDYVSDLVPAHISRLLRSAEPVQAARSHHFPASRWRRYDMAHLPAGLLVIGDAVCSLNPVYGQGMTVTALQAEALAGVLASGGHGLTARVHKVAAAAIERAWQLARSGDRVHQDPRTLAIAERLDAAATRTFMRAATRDAQLTERFLRVLGMLEPARLLQTPGSLFRIARGSVLAPR
jgi:2-polyprenyl-6-methoxyphenol hydroxylase-like FAD-dependent oxidoreductase